MRQRTLEVYVEGSLATNGTSSGTTIDLETIELPGTPAQMVELRGVLESSEWLSIAEVRVRALIDRRVLYTVKEAFSIAPGLVIDAARPGRELHAPPRV